MKNLLFLLIGAIALISSCKPDDIVEPVNCDQYPSNFEIEMCIQYSNGCTPGYNYGDLYPIPKDTLPYKATVYFKGKYEYDSLRWTIGTDSRTWTSSVVRISFVDQFSSVQVRMIGFRPTDSGCFGLEDDGIDTLSRIVYFKDHLTSPILGTYRGTNDGETDSFEMTVFPNSSVLGSRALIEGFPKGFSFPDENVWNIGYLRTSFYGLYEGQSQGVADSIIGCTVRGELDEDDPDILTMQWQSRHNRGVNRTFTGRRVQ